MLYDLIAIVFPKEAQCLFSINAYVTNIELKNHNPRSLRNVYLVLGIYYKTMDK